MRAASRGADPDRAAIFRVGAAAIVAGLLNFAVDCWLGGIAPASSAALVRPGLLLVPAGIGVGLSRFVRFITGRGARQARRRKHLRAHHEEILSALHALSQAFKAGKPRDPAGSDQRP